MKQAELNFAQRFDGVTGSAIREIFKLLHQPGMISFAGGNPADFALEDTLLADISRDVLLRDGKKLLQYGATEGWAPFRAETAHFLRGDVGVDVTEAEVLPTAGSTQAVDLLLKALVNEGDTVLAEGPSFLGSLQAMRLYGANIVSVDMDGDGIRLDLLEEAAKKHRPKLLYTIPNFQNPTGVTMSLERRKAVAALAEKYDFIVAEDDPYRGLRYEGEPLPSIFSFDEGARVVYMTSFSKLIAPGLRVGALATKHQPLLRKLTIAKQSVDLHTAALTQAVVAEYLARGLLQSHLTSILGRYREQLSRMLERLRAFPEGVRHYRTQGGLFVWAELPEKMNAADLLKRAIEKGVAYVPGTHFYADGGHLNTFRLNFSNSEVDRIDKGMDLLRQCIEEAM